MADVFISYSSRDKVIADAVCARLEGERIRCWIAPRDILPGADWGEAIVRAIGGSRVMVLVFSAHANASRQVRREVQRAFEKGLTVIPLRVEEVAPVEALEYYIGPVHWLDALTPPLEQHLHSLAARVRLLVRESDGGPESTESAKDADPPVTIVSPKPKQVAAAPREPAETVTNSVGITLKLIPAGEFLMGSPDSDKEAQDNEKPQHRVRITRPFCLGTHEVTQDQYQKVMGQNPSYFQGDGNRPVEQVSWEDAVEFCNALSAKEGLAPFYQRAGDTWLVPDWSGPGYRLPTEAEWEYACRAGSATRYSFGDDAAGLGDHAWFVGNSGDTTHPVGQKRPNGFGLFDMHGNAYEWCWDVDNSDYYRVSPVDDPRGPDPSRAASRVRRGGSWLDYPRIGRSAFRDGVEPGNRLICLGFRVARVPSDQ